MSCWKWRIGDNNWSFHGRDGGNQKEQESYPIQISFADSLTDFKPESAARIRLSHTSKRFLQGGKQKHPTLEFGHRKPRNLLPPGYKAVCSEFLRSAFQPWKGASFWPPRDETGPNRRGTGTAASIWCGGRGGKEMGRESEKTIASGTAHGEMGNAGGRGNCLVGLGTPLPA